MRISDWSSDVCSSDLCDTPADACRGPGQHRHPDGPGEGTRARVHAHGAGGRFHKHSCRHARHFSGGGKIQKPRPRSEEHTSELQSLMRTSYAVFCLTKTKKDTHLQFQSHTNSHNKQN